MIKIEILIPVEIDTEDLIFSNEDFDKAYKIFKEDLITEVDRVFPFEQGVFSANIKEISYTELKTIE